MQVHRIRELSAEDYSLTDTNLVIDPRLQLVSITQERVPLYGVL